YYSTKAAPVTCKTTEKWDTTLEKCVETAPIPPSPPAPVPPPVVVPVDPASCGVGIYVGTYYDAVTKKCVPQEVPAEGEISDWDKVSTLANQLKQNDMKDIGTGTTLAQMDNTTVRQVGKQISYYSW